MSPSLRNKLPVLRLVLVGLLLCAYLAGSYRSLSEASRRSLTLRDDLPNDCLRLKVNIASVNTKAAELTAHLEFRPLGQFAQDKITPTRDIELLINSAKGDQVFRFPKGERMYPIDVVFTLGGSTNEYPFDRHQASLWLLATTPRQRQKQGAAPEDKTFPSGTDVGLTHFEPLEVDTKRLLLNEPIPIAIDFSASVPGLKFDGQLSRGAGQGVTGILLSLSRSEEVIVLSLLVMVLMMVLSVSIFIMTLKATHPGRGLELVPLSLAMSLLFGLPALRNIQPDIPIIGIRGDLMSFISAEVIVAVSIIVIAWTWILRSSTSH